MTKEDVPLMGERRSLLFERLMQSVTGEPGSALFLPDGSPRTVDDVYDAKLKARRYRLQHDNAFYGPLKDVRCGCFECGLAADVIWLSNILLTDGLAEPVVVAPVASGHDARFTPSQELVLEVLASRYRCGEHVWTFRNRHAKTLGQLQDLGYVFVMHGVVDGTVRAGLTDRGKEATLLGWTPGQK